MLTSKPSRSPRSRYIQISRVSSSGINAADFPSPNLSVAELRIAIHSSIPYCSLVKWELAPSQQSFNPHNGSLVSSSLTISIPLGIALGLRRAAACLDGLHAGIKKLNA